MSASRRQAGPTIVGAEIAAGHDGAAELVVRLRYSNGADGSVVLDGARGFALLRRCGVEHVADLCGQPWKHLSESLECTTF